MIYVFSLNNHSQRKKYKLTKSFHALMHTLINGRHSMFDLLVYSEKNTTKIFTVASVTHVTKILFF